MDNPALMDFINQNNAFMRRCGITLTQVTDQQVTARVEAGPELWNPAHNLHGGVYFTMADAAATTLCRTDGRQYVTADSDIRFLRGVSGGTVLAQARAIHRGRRSCVVQVDITDEAGARLALFTANFACVGDDYRK